MVFLVKAFVVIHVILSSLSLTSSEINDSKFEKCFMTSKQKKFDVLPGLGWDNLENVEKGRVLDLRFSKCQFSDDNKYLIPGALSLIPKKSSKLELFSETFDHYNNYTSTTSRSMKADASGIFHAFSLGGGFSNEFTQVKVYQLESKSKITRVQLRYQIYRSKFEPDSPLSKPFEDRILNFAKWIKNYNNTLYLSYLADTIIRDFGTHVIRSVDAGAVLSKTDTLKQNYVRTHVSDTSKIGASASASFLDLFKLGGEYQTSSSKEEVNIYNKNTVRTIIKTYGGMAFGTQMGVDKWVSSVNDNLVAIDQIGEPLYQILNRKILPMLSGNMIHKIQNLLQDSINRYYTANARKGCLDFLSPNFNPDANIDGEVCKPPIVNFNFGGLYKSCDGPDDQCGQIRKPNILTGSYTCPTGFSSAVLHSGRNECREICRSSWIFWKKCHTECSDFKIFWCYPNNPGLNHNGYRFGGLISDDMPMCPPEYQKLEYGSLKLCVTVNTSPKDKSSIEFGGFYSCSMGNPLAQSFFKDSKPQSSPSSNPANWLKGCAEGFVGHIATIDQNCQISFCTETNKFSLGPTPVLRRLPFFKVVVSLNVSAPKSLYLRQGKMFITNFKAEEIKNPKVETVNYVLASVTIVCTLIVLAIAITLLVRYKQRVKKRQNYSPLLEDEKKNNYQSI